MISQRIKELQRLSAERWKTAPPTHFNRDLHGSALGRFKDLPHAEKLARSMAYAIENQTVFAYEDDRIGGRIYYKELGCSETCPAFDYTTEAEARVAKELPQAKELLDLQLISKNAKGHITWAFDRILRYGTEGYKAIFENAFMHAKDKESEDFYRGVIILLDGMQAFSDRHIAEYERLGNYELAKTMERVPRHPAQTFREAVQSFFMQHIVVMRENPFGGNSPGRLDYYLWPYLERDLRSGRCSMEEAKELIDELFLRIDERIHQSDMWGETVVVGGSYPNGASAENPLTHIMVRSMIDLNITHPLLYIRLPKDPSKELIDLCVEYLINGHNRAQILYDPAIIEALTKSGVRYRDAVEYACGGCMEIGIQGMQSDYLYNGWQNTPKMLELMITGGKCLLTGKQYPYFQTEKGLAGYKDFESFYRDFIKEAKQITEVFLRQQDIFSEVSEKNRPSYLISSMVDDCLARGRNMHAGGAKYHDYGGTHLGRSEEHTSELQSL